MFFGFLIFIIIIYISFKYLDKNIFDLKSRSKYTARLLYEYQIKSIYQWTKLKPQSTWSKLQRSSSPKCFSDSFSVILNRYIIPVVHLEAHLLQWLMFCSVGAALSITLNCPPYTPTGLDSARLWPLPAPDTDSNLTNCLEGIPVFAFT